MKIQLIKPAFYGAVVWFLILAAGCTIVDTSKTPDLKKLPFKFGLANDSAASPTISWRQFFADPILVRLIDTALASNPDMMMAFQRMEMSRARVRASKGAMLPTLSGGVQAAQRKFGLYTMDGAGNITTEITQGRIVPIHLPDYFVGVQSSWEADIWGKLRYYKKVALSRYMASEAGKHLVQTNLVYEVATAYYELIALDTELEMVQENISLQENALVIVRIQRQAGAANELAVKQFEAQVANSKALRLEVMQRLVENENFINLMLGRFQQVVERNKQQLVSDLPTAIQIGLPSALLENRPDIRMAGFELAATRFDVLAAKAAFYPSLNLTGSLGYQAFDPAYFLKTPESYVYSLIGGLAAPLLNRSAVKSYFQAAKASQLEALYQYQKTVLNAFAEADIEMRNIRNLQQINELKTVEVNAQAQSIEISGDLFKTGQATYLEVLYAQQNALRARLELITIQKRRYQSAAGLYKALGGGWK